MVLKPKSWIFDHHKVTNITVEPQQPLKDHPGFGDENYIKRRRMFNNLVANNKVSPQAASQATFLDLENKPIRSRVLGISSKTRLICLF